MNHLHTLEAYVEQHKVLSLAVQMSSTAPFIIRAAFNALGIMGTAAFLWNKRISTQAKLLYLFFLSLFLFAMTFALQSSIAGTPCQAFDIFSMGLEFVFFFFLAAFVCVLPSLNKFALGLPGPPDGLPG
ncbi:hypothetical protein F4820DRAFT_442292 [Hypoxylon rubiginosum]|uniref:Uncharacterized protein n=1 Tax=Hypoxylon rubiginosum TaxID=110542 RepID=A0ACB9YG81_9PEZI|nr:hypothetical protein F4820DRAFT_442292 [Hypoxylon rubiginosum]